MVMSSPSISSVIIAKNEAQNISACIESCLQVSDEVIVVDSHSTDDTVKIAKRKGAHVHSIEWQGYGHAKNYGASMAASAWILSIDADERIDNEMVDSLYNIKLAENHFYGFRRLNHIGKVAIKHGEWNPDIKYRLYNKERCTWNLDAVHEQLVSGPWQKKAVIPGYIMHYSYDNPSDMIDKLDHYARLAAQQMYDNKTPIGQLTRLKPFFRFLKSYYLKGGFLDGKLGYLIAKANADSTRNKYAYLKEMLKK